MKNKKEQSQEEINEIEMQDENQQDEEDILSGSLGFIQKNKNILIIASAAIVIIVALIFYFRHDAAVKNEQASLALSRIIPVYTKSDYKLALAGDVNVKVRGESMIGLQKIADEYSGTDAGKIASLLTGNALLALQKPADAERYFDIASGSSSDLVTCGGFAGLGACSEYAGNFSDAAKYYEKASNLSTQDGIKSRYTYYAGYCFEKSGDKEKAEKYYREIVNNIQFTEFTGNAKEGLIRLGTIIE